MKNDKSIGIIKKQECSGCELCLSICKCKSITMKKDREGFYYPHVDYRKCIQCGLCLKFCTSNFMSDHEGNLIKEYAGASSIDLQILSSASGGMSYSFNKYVIEQKGKIVGVKWTNNCYSTEYGLCTEQDDLEKFRSSKYIMAKKGSIYSEIYREAINSRNTILFTGLPCEVAAVTNYFKYKNCEIPSNLILCDLICFGPTSENLLCDFISIVSKMYKSDPIETNMRMKIEGLERPHMYLKYSSGIFIKPLYELTIGQIFSEFGRRSCANCHFQDNKSYADISIGDFVTDDDMLPFYKKEGISRIIIRSTKGDDFMNSVPDISVFETNGKTKELYKYRRKRTNGLKRITFFMLYKMFGYKVATRVFFRKCDL